jgi:O-antigen/teichoic acid export membrane protein
MTTVAANAIANFVGRSWTMLIGMVFAPVYLRLLGIEAYGLIGFFLTLQSVLGIMDLGLSLTLNRELARASSATADPARMARVLRTTEIAYWTLSVIVGLAVVVLAPVIAGRWLNAAALPVEQVQRAVQLMGVIIALQAPFALYQGGLAGLQRQVSANAIVAVAATLRAVGATAVLWLLFRRVEAYFVWQLLIAALATAVCARKLWQLIPGGRTHAAFDLSLGRQLWRFTAAVSANAIVGVALTQLDKLILVKLLTLEQFGYYMLATLVASALWGIILPINASLYPRFVQLYEQRDHIGLAELYHKASQVMAAVLLPVALMLIAFPYELVLLWTGDAATARNTALIVAMLSTGTLINGVTSVAAYLQSAIGWPTLMLWTNTALALLLVPLLLVTVPRFGPVGAAGVWIAISISYLVFTVPVMHRRILKGELMRWYAGDVLIPAAAVTAVGLVARISMGADWPALANLAYLVATWGVAVLAAVLVLPRVRTIALDFAARYRPGRRAA